MIGSAARNPAAIQRGAPGRRPGAARRLALAALALVAVGLASLGAGSLELSPAEALRALLGLGGSEAVASVVRDLRAPRFLVAAGAGAALALAGAILQTVARNPLADPGLLGVNAGAALGVVAVISTGAASGLALAGAAFAGGLAAAGLVLALGGRSPGPARLVLTGVGVSAIAGALISIFTVAAGVADAQRALVWLSGSLNGRGWATVLWLLPPLVPLAVLAFAAARPLDALALDPSSARGLGLAMDRAQLGFVILATGCAALATAAAGAIAFIGLAAPHLARMAGGPGHGALLPLAALIGAGITAAADLAGRTAFAPTEIPAGLVSAALGAPWFLWLMRRRLRV